MADLNTGDFSRLHDDIRELKDEMRSLRETLHANLVKVAIVETKLGFIGVIAGMIGAGLVQLAVVASRLFF